jgi:hypothetical protein
MNFFGRLRPLSSLSGHLGPSVPSRVCRSLEPDARGRVDLDDAAPKPEATDVGLSARGADDPHHARGRDRLLSESSDAVTTTENTLSPAATLALGAIALVAAFVVGTGRHQRVGQRRRAHKKDKGPPRWQQALGKGPARTTSWSARC